MNNLKFSVIIPVYNTEKYIRKCLDSLVHQTYKNLQIILVDDGTQDTAGAICDEYATKYSMFEVYHKENEGLALTRNYGMKYITGDYFTFVDSDDWVDKNYFEIANKYLKKQHVDIAMTSYIREYAKASVKNELFTRPNIVFDKKKTQKLLRRLVGEVGPELKHPGRIEDYNTAWAKFYNTSKFKEIKSENGKRSEDLLFNIHCFLITNDAGYIGNTYYHYNRQNDESIVSNLNIKLKDQFKALYSEINNIIDENKLGLEYKVALNNRVILNLITIAINYGTTGQLNLFKRLHILKNVLADDMYVNAFKNFDFSYLPKKYKVFFLLCKKRSVFLLYLTTNLAMKERDRIKR